MVSPVSLSPRMRSSARARSRCRTSRSGTARRGVGGECGDPPAVDVGDLQLRAGMGAFAADEDPGAGRPPEERRGHQPGEFGDLGALAGSPVGVQRGPPALFGQCWEGVLQLAGRHTRRVGQPSPEMGHGNPCTPDPASPRTSTRPRTCSGSWVSAASSTATWSAAVLAFARPARSMPTRGSPVAPAPGRRRPASGGTRTPA